MRTVVGIMIAGGIGAALRYGVDGVVSQRTGGLFPWGTFVANISGSLLLGFLFTLLTERMTVEPWLRSTLTMGFVGAYTTFSTLSLETARMIENRAFALALANTAGSVMMGVLAIFVGMTLGRII